MKHLILLCLLSTLALGQDAPPVRGARDPFSQGRITPVVPPSPWPIIQISFEPCFTDDPSCVDQTPRIFPTQEKVETVQMLVVAYFRVQVLKGTLKQDMTDPCWEGWTLEQKIASGCMQSMTVPWYQIKPMVQFSYCFFLVPDATDGSGRPPAPQCAAGMTDGKGGRIVVSAAEKDRTLPLIAWETGNFTVSKARLSDPACPSGTACTMSDGSWVSKATTFAMEAIK
jgi:hypothetical protein